MMPTSLRLRLPLTYAAIALLAVLVLGMVLLATLRGIYRRQELDYLVGNAAVIAETLAPPMEDTSTPTGWLQAQVAGLAFLTQARVRVTDAPGTTTLADSGEPGAADGATRIAVEVTVGDVAQSFSRSVEQEGDRSTTSFTSSIIVEDSTFSRNIDKTIVTTRPADEPLDSRLPAIGTLFGFGLDAAQSQALARSNLAVRQAILDPGGEALGFVELSQGPAYGRAIMRSVALAWAVAGGVAVALAALAGGLISRRITTPLLTLTDATRQMARGDLSVRAATARRDEIGLLTDSFNQMVARVETMVATLHRFVADAAHEFHTPLTAIRSDLDLLAENAGVAERARLRRVQEQTLRLEQLTANLLDLSNIESGSGKNSFASVAFDSVVRSASEPYASQAEQRDIAFTLALPSRPVIVWGDGGQLRRAAGNLLDNALKFTPSGGEVRVTLVEDGGWASLQIADTGIGIPAEDLPDLFDRFHRGRNAAAFPGSGLGLAITKAIVEGHGGAITVASSASGTELFVRLPTATGGESGA